MCIRDRVRAQWLRAHGGEPQAALTAALDFARRLQQGDPTSCEGPLLEGRILLARTSPDPTRACILAEQAVKLNPRSAPGWLLLARARQASGQRAEARAALAKAATLLPRLAGLAELRAALNL